ncbi:hypothetical protein [Amycolatopsis sp. cmx-4-68]|uniref:hypothetical protein n=1 Tax=Amycolatopsis sp. cmx-4-68 TaxID=2790938 RepID=UPI0039785E6E
MDSQRALKSLTRTSDADEVAEVDLTWSSGTVAEIPGRCRVVAPIDLLDEDVDLTPARHLPSTPVELDLADVARSRDH